MSTLEDFENAPVGATATSPNGNIALKTGRRDLEWSVYDPRGWYRDNYRSAEMVLYTLTPAAPTTSREALDLAWDLGHEVKEGQTIPGRERTIGRYEDGDFFLGMSLTDRLVTESEQSHLRTFDPLPDPLPDWLDAPVVIARVGDHKLQQTAVFTPTGVRPDRYIKTETGATFHWTELMDVVPLYPKDTARPLPTREEIANALHGDNCPDDPDPDESCSCGAGDYDRMGDIVLALLKGQDR